jgi:asparagine synthase (glutamine-hydrolysing)
MSGFTAVIFKNKKATNSLDVFSLRREHELKMICRTVETDSYTVQQLTNSKFLKDKIFEQNEAYFIGIEGVLLNVNELKTNESTTVFDLLISLYENHGNDFVKQLRGDFSGFIYDKKADSWLVFTNQTGSKRVFIFEDSNYLFFASDLNRIAALMSELKIPRKLNTEAAYSLLTSGFMLNEISFIEGVNRLLPGCYLAHKNGKTSISNYFHLKNIERTTDSKAQIIEKVDALFQQAIKREFEKDKEYNYKHIATLSGGLDSRMTVLMAHKMGYTDQLNFTFSQANYLDEQIAKQIAVDHRHEFMFQSLDHGNYLRNVDEIVSFNDGMIIFSGGAHVLKSCKNMNFDDYGLIHTGLIGDAVLGSFLSKPYAIKPSLTASAYSSKLIHKAEKYIDDVQQNFESEELYKFYGRAFLGAMNGNYYLDVYSQSVSPFLDVDFLSYCYSIPDNLKFKQKIYIDWIAQKNKEFANYPWEKTGVSPLISLNNKKYLALGYYKRMSLKFFDKLSGKLKSGMNPFDYWLDENKALAQSFVDYFENNLSVIENDELRNDCRWLFENGNWGERFQVLTLLSAIKLHLS